ncbi:hypothetical protein Tco_1164828 [Tanacetum coccineum]
METSESLQPNYRGNNQAPAYQSPVHQGQIYRPQMLIASKANDCGMRNMQNPKSSLQTQGQQTLQNLLTRIHGHAFHICYSPIPPLLRGILPSTPLLPAGVFRKGITTEVVVAYKGPRFILDSSLK